MSKQQIYDALRNAGISHAGAIGIMGNLQAESGCESCRLQGDYELGRTRSKEYAAKVDSGELSRHIFSMDGQGWGVYQLTYHTRKAGFHDFVKANNGSIADMELQLRYMVKELKEDFPNLWQFLRVTTSVWNSTKRFCEEFERPAVNNIQARYAMAQAIESELSVETKPKKESYWPPRTIDKNMSGPDVAVLQSILKARGYEIDSISGIFDDLLEREVKAFQKDNMLSADGVVGPKTWAVILET